MRRNRSVSVFKPIFCTSRRFILCICILISKHQWIRMDAEEFWSLCSKWSKVNISSYHLGHGESSWYVGLSVHQFDGWIKLEGFLGSWLFTQTSTLFSLKTKVIFMKTSNMTFMLHFLSLQQFSLLSSLDSCNFLSV